MNWDLVRIRLRKLLAIIMHRSYRRAFLRHRVAPAIDHAAVLRRLPFDFVADVGANRGQFSLVCRQLRPSAAIIAFEPLAEPAQIYRALFAGDPRVRLHECALARERGEMTMHLSARDDSSSLLPISEAQTANFPGTGAVGVRSVAVGPLSDFVQPSELGSNNLLKIDVQGFELEVLKSAESLLPQFDWIYAECSFVPLYEGQALAPEVIAFLGARDFRLSGRFNPFYGKEGAMLQADLLFENIKRA
ncbi:MAG TPA: FkbM family methyltransferase [Rhizomicrobium sp.]|nr:FkbM family methyltransferase [Rhizomicrobium sp.]